ncbi:helix-turn-helix domain-containing protein [Gordonia polyisoprenivorans]|uniref:helix-turn-helix domain-containing protein n=1 Tax=Gordonia polyisoprenivorans TaxID=84595 RepID=UPI001B8B9452|nr:helix-turn-helix domain-containing protein [Gordonia polyisoprenivorans]QUD82094.1 helix-turn-helix domain-containing protein [Gordonia polyisoprenivorans]
MAIEPVHPGVLLGVDDVAEVLRVIAAFETVLAERHSRPSPRLLHLRTQLTRANTRVSGRDTHADARKLAAQQDSGAHFAYELLDTGQAAEIIGISADGVRDLARRHRIPARKAGGRWVYPASAIAIYASTRT